MAAAATVPVSGLVRVAWPTLALATARDAWAASIWAWSSESCSAVAGEEDEPPAVPADPVVPDPDPEPVPDPLPDPPEVPVPALVPLSEPDPVAALVAVPEPCLLYTSDAA